MKKRSVFLVVLSMMLSGCSSGSKANNGGYYYNNDAGFYYSNATNIENEEYNEINEVGYQDPSINPLSSFSLDSSSYAYSNLRRLIKNNYHIDKDAVVIEQMLNYFNYSYINETEEALSSTLELASCPWNEEHYLASISVNAKEIEMNDTKNNFVFLIDSSGSMNSENKLPLLKEAFKLFSDSLNENDTVSVVTYASGVRVIANGVKGNEKLGLIEAIEGLEASGGTNGSGGIQLAYDILEENFIQGGNNRILLATDGDFNIGISNQDDLSDFISGKRQKDMYLSIFGFGQGNTKHNLMETLASDGNGNAYYIDSVYEAKRVFVSELGSVLNTVAKDAKIQVEFNPNTISKYRLLGYENKMMSNEEFNDENKDAGEIGEGHTAIAMYEIELKENPDNEYYFKTTLRYKDVELDEENKEVDSSINYLISPSNDFIFAASVVEFGLILRDSSFKGNANYDSLINRLENLDLSDDPYKVEFVELVKQAKKNYTLNS